jgi:cytochrome c-type biogenesis protein CcmH/NrfF
MKWGRPLVAVVMAVGAIGMVVGWRTGGDATPCATAARLTSQLMSPFCPGLLLSDCPSSGAAALRAEIRERLDRHEAPDHIVTDLVARYGTAIEASPEATGLGLLVWWAPAAVAMVSFGAVASALRRAARHGRENARAHAAVAVPTYDAIRLRRVLEDELDRLA